MLRNLSHDFARYVINTVGLEDIGCRYYLYKLLVGFQQKILKIAFERLRNKFYEEFFNGSHRVSSPLFDTSTKSTIVYVFIVLLTDHRY